MIEQIISLIPWAVMTAGGAGIGVWAAKRHAHIQTTAVAEQTPVQTMQSQVTQAQAEATISHEKYTTFVESQIKAYQAERGQLTGVLTELKDSVRAIKDEVTAHRGEETARAGKVYEALSAVANRLTAIEVRVDLRNGAA